MAGRAKRLNKLAKEYSISISTIVEYLHIKGIEVDSKPNTKIEPDIVAVLDEEFGYERDVNQIYRDKEESSSLKDVKKDSDTQNESAEKKDASDAVHHELTRKKKAAVVGKIDLDAINQDTKSKNKLDSEESKPENTSSTKLKSQELAKPDLGKIVLPIEKVESNSENNRKRIKKVNAHDIDIEISIFKELNCRVFLGEYKWGMDNLFDIFINENRWEFVRQEHISSTVNSAKPGDLLFLKSINIAKNVSYLKIRAFGIIRENPQNGHDLSVHWIKNLDKFINISDLSKLTYAFGILPVFDYHNLFKHLKVEIPNFVDEVKPLVITYQKLANQNKSSMDGATKRKTDSIERFWWYQNNSPGWNMSDWKEGNIQAISTSSKNSGRREVYDHFFTIKKGEYLIGVEGKKTNAAVCLLQLHKEVDDEFGGELLVKVVAKYKEVLYRSALNIFEAFNDSPVLTNETANLLELSADQFETINTFFDGDKIKATKEEENNEIEEQEESGVDKIPFHLDKVVDDDKLGREPVARAFVKILKEDIFTPLLNHSFIVHLQGEWGAGKSTFLKLIHKHLNAGEEDWIIIDYNAWQNQHITPPWWTLIDQIYRQSKDQMSWRRRWILRIKEGLRRVIWYSGWKTITSFLITGICITLLILFGDSLLESLSHYSENQTNINGKENGMAVTVFAKLLVTIGSGIGLVYSFSKFISTPLFMRNSDEAETFLKKATDPMLRIKRHFNRLVNDINQISPKEAGAQSNNRQLAIFIDDIDRCNREFIVQLLEGIQTLFKEERVLYIVAGDKHWITKSFGLTYQEFCKENEKKNDLGKLFLEKAFQLSLRMPEVSEQAKQDYWHHILGYSDEDNKEIIVSIDDLDSEVQSELNEELEVNREKLYDPEYLKAFAESHQLSGDTVSNLVLDKTNADTEEIRHLLIEFHQVIDSNPRKVKRLANNYTMARSTLIAERRHFVSEKLFRWLALVDQFPKLEIYYKEKLTFSNFEKADQTGIFPLKGKERFEPLFYDKDEQFGGPLTDEDINEFLGY